MGPGLKAISMLLSGFLMVAAGSRFCIALGLVMPHEPIDSFFDVCAYVLAIGFILTVAAERRR